MRSLLARLAVLGAFAVSVSACSSGHDSSLPFGGPPNNNGGSIANLQTGANGTALIRFVQGSPDVGQVDVCIDQTSATAATKVAFKGSSLIGVAGGISHVVSVYAAAGGGSECATAPGPFNGTLPIATTTVTPANSTRQLVALAGRAGKNLGLFVYNSPTFVNTPTGPEAVVYNASPAFGAVGFGYALTATGGTPVNLTGTSATQTPYNVPAPKAAAVTGTSTPNASFTANLPGQPPFFFVGAGVSAVTTPIVPITIIPSPTGIAGMAYIVDLISVDSGTTGKPVDLAAIPEVTVGYGF